MLMGHETLRAPSFEACCEGTHCQPSWSDKESAGSPDAIEATQDDWLPWVTTPQPVWPRVFPSL
jgi:hypothetical protein